MMTILEEEDVDDDDDVACKCMAPHEAAWRPDEAAWGFDLGPFQLPYREWGTQSYSPCSLSRAPCRFPHPGAMQNRDGAHVRTCARKPSIKSRKLSECMGGFSS